MLIRDKMRVINNIMYLIPRLGGARQLNQNQWQFRLKTEDHKGIETEEIYLFFRNPTKYYIDTIELYTHNEYALEEITKALKVNATELDYVLDTRKEKTFVSGISFEFYFYTGFAKPIKVNLLDTEMNHNFLGNITHKVIREVIDMYDTFTREDLREEQPLSYHGLWLDHKGLKEQLEVENERKFGLAKEDYLKDFKENA